MTQQTINVGAAPNDGTGDPLQTAFTKSNANFTELYARGNLTAPQGRLTLLTGTPVMTTTQAAKTTIYYSPYCGSLVPIWNGSNFVMTSIGTEISTTTTDTTKNPAAVGANQVHDWYVWLDGSTVRLCHGPAWTNDTTRSGTVPQMLNGIRVNNIAITNGPTGLGGTYVGTTRSNSSSQLDWIYGGVGAGGVQAFLGVWNAYNRCSVAAFVGDNVDSWTYAVAAWRVAGGAANMFVRFISGLAEDAFSARYYVGTTGSPNGGIGVGINSTTVPTHVMPFINASGTVSAICEASGSYMGFGFVAALEYGNASTTFLGDAGLSWAQLSGLHFNFMM